MIRFVYADELERFPHLAESMFRDRADQFKARLGWNVTVDGKGRERDQYDALNPLYVIWEEPDGMHGGSLRLMPTTGRTMASEHFIHLTHGVRICSPLIWECTRFCLSPRASSRVAAALLAAGIELGLRFGLEQAIGVVYTRTLGIYRRMGHEPDVIGSDGDGRDSISICIWNLSQAAQDSICARSGLSPDTIARWFDGSFPGSSAAGPAAIAA